MWGCTRVAVRVRRDARRQRGRGGWRRIVPDAAGDGGQATAKRAHPLFPVQQAQPAHGPRRSDPGAWRIATGASTASAVRTTYIVNTPTRRPPPCHRHHGHARRPRPGECRAPCRPRCEDARTQGPQDALHHSPQRRECRSPGGQGGLRDSGQRRRRHALHAPPRRQARCECLCHARR